MAGASTHILAQEPPQHSDKNSVPDAGGEAAQILALSARTSKTLEDLALRYLEFLKEGGLGLKYSLSEICYTANRRDAQHDSRIAALGRSHPEICRSLDSYLAGKSSFGLFQGCRSGGRGVKLVFVFTGMGAQRWGMGRQLYEQEPVFRETAKECDEMFRRVGNVSLLTELLAKEEHSRMNEPVVAQACNFTVQVSLVALWKAWGVQPDAVVGHSAGEVAAAFAAGVLSLDDAIQVNYHQSRISEHCAGRGSMMAISLPVAETRAEIAAYNDRISLAAENAPASTTVSGELQALHELAVLLRRKRISCRNLHVKVAYHSHQINPFEHDLAESLADIRPRVRHIPMYSTVAAGPITGPEADATYWWRNVRNPVGFRETVYGLARDGYRTFLEVGPNRVLSSSLSECFAELNFS